MATSFGQLIKMQRIDMGLTQQRLAELVGRSPSTIRSWERERTIPNDADVLVTLAAVLGIDPAELGDLAGIELDPGFAQPRLMVPTSASQPESDALPNGQEFNESAGINELDQAEDPIPTMAEREVGLEVVEPVGFAEESDAGGASEPEVSADSVDGPSESAPPEESVGPSPVEVIEFEDAELEIDVTELVDLDEASSEASSEDADTSTDWVGAPTEVIMLEERPERLLGIATAQGVEFVAEPRRPIVAAPEPEPVDIDPAAAHAAQVPVVSAVAPTAATAPVDVVRTAARPAQRTQTLVSARPQGPNSYLEDPKEVRGYRIRAALTVVALIGLLLAARWAWAGFREQVGNILDSFITGF